MIEFKGIGKAYVTGGQRVDALNRVDMDISRGEMVALCGPKSGSGKNTLLNVLGLLLDMDYRGRDNYWWPTVSNQANRRYTFSSSVVGFCISAFQSGSCDDGAWERRLSIDVEQCRNKNNRPEHQDMLERVGLGEYHIIAQTIFRAASNNASR